MTAGSFPSGATAEYKFHSLTRIPSWVFIRDIKHPSRVCILIQTRGIDEYSMSMSGSISRCDLPSTSSQTLVGCSTIPLNREAPCNA